MDLYKTLLLISVPATTIIYVITTMVMDKRKKRKHKDRCRKLINELQAHMNRGVTDALFVPSEDYSDLIPDGVMVYDFYLAFEVESRRCIGEMVEPEDIIKRVQRLSLDNMRRQKEIEKLLPRPLTEDEEDADRHPPQAG